MPSRTLFARRDPRLHGPVTDVALVLLTVGLFAALTLVVRAVERL
jgi:hypothetical protein